MVKMLFRHTFTLSFPILFGIVFASAVFFFLAPATSFADWSPDTDVYQCPNNNVVTGFDCTGGCDTSKMKVFCSSFPSSSGPSTGWTPDTDIYQCPNNNVVTGFDCTGGCDTSNMRVYCSSLPQSGGTAVGWSPDTDVYQCPNNNVVTGFDCTGGCDTPNMRVLCAPVPPGTIIVKTIKDGIAWDSPPIVVNYSGPGGIAQATIDTDNNGQQTFLGSMLGTYTFNNVIAPPGVLFLNVNGFQPPYSQILTANGTVIFTFNFKTQPPSTGTVQVRATKDGLPWNSPPFTANVNQPGLAGDVVVDPPQDFPGTVLGMYTVNRIDAPAGVSFRNVNGSSLPYGQTLAGGGTITFTVNFTTVVVSPPAVPTFVISPTSASVQIGGTQQFNAVYDPDGSGPLPPLYVTNSSLWSSSNSSVATVTSTGMATGNAAGSAGITAQYSGLMASASLAVTAPVPTLTVSPSSASVAIGGTQQFIATYDPDGSGPNPSQDVTATAAWSSSDASKVTVSGGLATRVGNGYTSITVSYSGLSRSATILDPATLRVSPSSKTLGFGETAHLLALYDPDGAGAQPEQDVTSSASWLSNRISVASVDNAFSKGLVTAGSTSGSAAIRASYGGLMGLARIRVNAPPAASLTVSCSASPTSVTTGQPVIWTAVASGGTGSFSYSWSGSSPLGGNVGNPVTVTYGTTGSKTGTVTVTSGIQTVLQSCNTSVNVTAAPAAPVVPSRLRVDPASLNSCGAIRLTWTDNSNNEDRFELERDSGSGFVNIANPSANATSFNDTTIAQNINNSYRIRACNAFGCSAYSNAVSGNNQSPSVDFSWTPASPKENQRVNFTHQLLSGIALNSWNWTFSGGNPAASTTPNPYSSFPAQGQHAVQLTAANANGSCSISHSVSVALSTPGDWCELPPDSPPGTPCP